MLSSIFLSLALFGASTLGQVASSTTGTATKTASGKSSVTSGGISTNGPLAVAENACFPRAFASAITDTPCFSMEVLNRACFYGPSVLETATATPSVSASPKQQQQCYCDPVNGAGYMYFEFMQGCSNCFRLHGSAGGPGAYSPEFISSLSKAYCAVQTPTLAFGKFLTSLAGTTAVATRDLSTSNVLGTKTAVSLYFTTIPLGAAANSTNSTSMSLSSAMNSTALSSAAAATTGAEGATTSLAAASGPTTSPPAPQATQTQNVANAVHVSGFLGAVILGNPAFVTSRHLTFPLCIRHNTEAGLVKTQTPFFILHQLVHGDSRASLSTKEDYAKPKATLEANADPSVAAYAVVRKKIVQKGWGSPETDITAVSENSRLGGTGRSIVGNLSTGISRSSSPAKRTRAEMEVTNDGEGDIEDVNMVPSGPFETLGEISEQPANKKVTRISQEPRGTREVSVDMMSDESGYSLSLNAYHTPQSGASSTSSTSRTSAPGDLEAERETLPPLDEQIARITQLSQQPSFEGMRGYVISNKWLVDAQERGTNAHKSSKEVKDDVLPPVDNRDLVFTAADGQALDLTDEEGNKFYSLKPGLEIAREIEIIPQQAWEQIIKWHGMTPGSPEIIRYCQNTSDTLQHLQFEMYPPVFTILKLPDRSGGLTPQALHEKDIQPPKVVSSRHGMYQKFLKRAKEAAGIKLDTRVRVWRVLSSLKAISPQVGMPTPDQSRSNSPAPGAADLVDLGNRLVIDVNSFITLQEGSQRELLDAKDETANAKYNGHSNLQFVGLGQEGILVLEEQIGGPAGGEWASDAAATISARNGPTKKTLSSVSNALWNRSNSTSGRTSPAAVGMMTRGRTAKSGRTRGTVGLGNLGNTCYMNSALQCVRSVEELTYYFLEDYYKRELNPRNPLAHNGDVAKAYASLLREMYGPASTSSFSPRQFKQTIGRYGPSFSGYGQQDSQEFLLFLLDGLQEDLNRIHKKPYIEKPDSTDEMVNNQKALREMADKCWEIYKARNDSVITDLFAGMYKSTVVCPICDKVSIIFDPFNNLTLQLPIEALWQREWVFFFPLYSRPVQVPVDIDRNASFFQLKEYVGKKVDVDPKRIVTSEIYKNKFFKMFDDKLSLSDERIADGDILALYEVDQVPSNYPPPKKTGQKVRSMLSIHGYEDDEEAPQEDSPLSDRILVPVFHRRPRGGNLRFQQKELFETPSYIVLNREEARNEDEILRKVLGRVATMTTVSILGDVDEQMQDQEPDAVLMNTDDVDSSSDTKVQADSVQSEDGIVDVSMRDTSIDQGPRISYPPRTRTSTAIPRMLQPGEFITPEARRLFEISVMSTNDMITTGWSSLTDESKRFPLLASRAEDQMRKQRKRASKGPSATRLARAIANRGSASSSEEDLDDPLPQSQPSTARAGTETTCSTDDESMPAGRLPKAETKAFGTFGRKTPRNKAGLITYSRKDRSRRSSASFKDESDSETATEKSPLINIGDAIILDWNTESVDGLFSGDESRKDEDDLRGASTWESCPKLTDPEIIRKRIMRRDRKKHGVTLDDCLDEFGKAEILSENDAWYCPRCKEHRRASKKFELWKAPDILVIHLKRFSAQGRLRDKLDIHVDFPTEALDLSSRVAVHEDGKELVYDLFAVDNHYGGLGGGHYTASAKNFYDQQWYEYNDSMANRKSNPSHVVTSAAYLLFYRRRSETPLGGSFFENLMNDASHSGEGQESQNDSRNQSPSALVGEGKRLDDSSRNGSSSASQEVGVVHQAGGGGLDLGMSMEQTTDDIEEELPDYSVHDPNADAPYESMETDEIGQPVSAQGLSILSSLQKPTWPGFPDTRRSSVSTTNAASLDDEDDRSQADWRGTYGNPGTPDDCMDAVPILEREPAPQIKIARPATVDEDDDPVMEIKLSSEGEESMSSRME